MFEQDQYKSLESAIREIEILEADLADAEEQLEIDEAEIVEQADRILELEKSIVFLQSNKKNQRGKSSS